ncbi:hypothetical protein CFU_4308 [Collimonas fungivorans Ter331]|uniref:Uncharacterized protein n=1 Tax=Collimonas fungivorans (strain Ter331) TaxID=1005048 RepID=G0AFP0_COLFT|nr:hypothetical protein CFU_4308 [Collimonas fungivorans Ter331]
MMALMRNNRLLQYPGPEEIYGTSTNLGITMREKRQ